MEQSLESYELCNLAETFPSKHDTYEEFQDTLEMAYLYAKSVTLVNTSWPEVNAVMMKNRRIGISQSGIINAMKKHGISNLVDWCDKGYKFLKTMDEKYSDWLCVPRSKKITTVKPSGCGVATTKIKTEKGIMSYEKIFKYFGYNLENYKDSKKTWLNINNSLKVYDENNELQEITKLFINGNVNVYSFMTEDGKSHEFTGDHKFKIKRNNEIKWIEVRNLKENDDIIFFN